VISLCDLYHIRNRESERDIGLGKKGMGKRERGGRGS
jgi:hypothetical protein